MLNGEGVLSVPRARTTIMELVFFVVGSSILNGLLIELRLNLGHLLTDTCLVETTRLHPLLRQTHH